MSVAHQLRYDLASEVAQTYRPIHINLLWIIHFMEQQNKRMGEVLKNHMSSEKGLYNPHQIILDNRPTLLKKVPIHTIRAICRISTHKKTTSLSSSTLGILLSSVFWSFLIILEMYSKECSMISFYSPLKISLKCSQAT